MVSPSVTFYPSHKTSKALEIGSQAEDAEMQSQPAESPRAGCPTRAAGNAWLVMVQGPLNLGEIFKQHDS